MYNSDFGNGGRSNFGGDRGPRQMFPVEPAVQCAHVDENGVQCDVMITELPFELRRDENGEPLKPVFCRDHLTRPGSTDRATSGGSSNFGDRQMFPVEPAVQCAHVDENGAKCDVMISELPFELRRDESGQPLKPVYCRNHVPRRDDSFRGGNGGGFRPRY